MKLEITLFLMFLSVFTIAQTIVGFEDQNIPLDTFNNGSDGSGGFSVSPVFLPNTYIADPQFPSWSGWSLSSKGDTITRGFTNQYSSITGAGFDNSNSFAVSFGASNVLQFLDTISRSIQGMYITNNTYAYYSMLEGDQFARKFGGETGNEPDFFLLTIKKYTEGELGPDSINVVLADYRFEDNTQDYIVRDWIFVDLSSLGPVDSLQFSLTTTVFNDFGPATPFYFCMDQMILDDVSTSTSNLLASSNIAVYPNPVIDYIMIEGEELSSFQLFNQNGQVLMDQKLRNGTNEIQVNHLAVGSYWIKIDNQVRKIVKMQ